MRKIIPLVVSGCLCLCMFGCGGSSSPATAPEETTQSQEQGASDSETNENKSETEAISETSKTTGKAEDIVGDWSGQAEVHLEYNEGPFEAVLSINPDNVRLTIFDVIHVPLRQLAIGQKGIVQERSERREVKA